MESDILTSIIAQLLTSRPFGDLSQIYVVNSGIKGCEKKCFVARLKLQDLSIHGLRKASLLKHPHVAMVDPAILTKEDPVLDLNSLSLYTLSCHVDIFGRLLCLSGYVMSANGKDRDTSELWASSYLIHEVWTRCKHISLMAKSLQSTHGSGNLKHSVAKLYIPQTCHK